MSTRVGIGAALNSAQDEPSHYPQIKTATTSFHDDLAAEFEQAYYDELECQAVAA
jgi:hypothetical protein